MGEPTGLSLWSWGRLILAALGVLLGFFGLINGISLAANNGFQWHPTIGALIEDYRQTFYPFYDVALAPFAAWLDIPLSPILKDGLTVILISFSAANAESFARDGTPLLKTLLVAGRFSWSREPIPPLTDTDISSGTFSSRLLLLSQAVGFAVASVVSAIVCLSFPAILLASNLSYVFRGPNHAFPILFTVAVDVIAAILIFPLFASAASEGTALARSRLFALTTIAVLGRSSFVGLRALVSSCVLALCAPLVAWRTNVLLLSLVCAAMVAQIAVDRSAELQILLSNVSDGTANWARQLAAGLKNTLDGW